MPTGNYQKRLNTYEAIRELAKPTRMTGIALTLTNRTIVGSSQNPIGEKVQQAISECSKRPLARTILRTKVYYIIRQDNDKGFGAWLPSVLKGSW
jgi:hypothetical protein